MKKVLQAALFVTLFSVCVAGCTSGGGKRRRSSGGGSSTSGTSATGTQEPGPAPDPSQHWENYTKWYMNKTDCYGQHVDDYHLETLTGRDLQVAIHHYLIDQHKKYYAYSAVNSLWVYSDMAKGTDKYEYFYTGWLHKDNSATREHMWCCANSNGMWYRNSKEAEWKMDDKTGEAQAYWGGGSDIYQLRPTSYEVNNKRQNYKYYVYKNGESYESITDTENGTDAPYSLKYNSTNRTCEVADYFKGDVARTLMYIYMHYNSFGDGHDVYYDEDHKPTYDIDLAVAEVTNAHTPYVCAPAKNGTPWLQFNLIMNYSENECIKLLKQWNEMDPPSDLEKQRNNYCSNSQLQGNRNPFIDYPQLVDRCFPDIN